MPATRRGRTYCARCCTSIGVKPIRGGQRYSLREGRLKYAAKRFYMRCAPVCLAHSILPLLHDIPSSSSTSSGDGGRSLSVEQSRSCWRGGCCLPLSCACRDCSSAAYVMVGCRARTRAKAARASTVAQQLRLIAQARALRSRRYPTSCSSRRPCTSWRRALFDIAQCLLHLVPWGALALVSV